VTLPSGPVGAPDPDAVALGLVDPTALGDAFLRIALRTPPCPVRGIPSALCELCSSGMLPTEMEHVSEADLVTMHWLHSALHHPSGGRDATG
jgi:hypothetical protein